MRFSLLEDGIVAMPPTTCEDDLFEIVTPEPETRAGLTSSSSIPCTVKASQELARLAGEAAIEIGASAEQPDLCDDLSSVQKSGKLIVLDIGR